MEVLQAGASVSTPTAIAEIVSSKPLASEIGWNATAFGESSGQGLQPVTPPDVDIVWTIHNLTFPHSLSFFYFIFFFFFFFFFFFSYLF